MLARVLLESKSHRLLQSWNEGSSNFICRALARLNDLRDLQSAETSRAVSLGRRNLRANYLESFRLVGRKL